MQYEEQGVGLSGWNRATSEFYGFDDLSDLQLSWVAWVRGGSKQEAAEKLARTPEPQLASTIQLPQQTFTRNAPRPAAAKANGQVRSLLDTDTAKVAFANQNDSWYASRMQVDATARAARRAQTIQTRKASVVDAVRAPQEPTAPVRDSRLPTDLMLR